MSSSDIVMGTIGVVMLLGAVILWLVGMLL